MSGGWRQAKLAGRRPLDGRVRRLMEQSLLANHERQFATPHNAWHELLAANRTQVTNRASTRPAMSARRAGTSRRLVPTSASEQRRRCARALREAESGLRDTCLETKTNRASERARAAPKQNPGQGPAMSATRSTRLRTTAAQPPPTTAKHSFENLRGSPAASGRTARLSSGAVREPPLCLCTQTCEPPNVGHERRLEACEARWKTSARWKG
jgi:hypothetical protein